MTVNEEMRHRVYEGLKALRGAEFAGAMMEMLPPAGVPELATKADLAVLESKLNELRVEFGGLRAEFGGLRAEFGGLRAEFDSFKAEIGGQIEAQTVRFIRWSAAIAGVSLTIAELLGRAG